MIKQISWNDYFSTVALVLIVYYLIVVVYFFRAEIGNLLSGNLSSRTESGNDQYSEDISNSSAQIVHKISDILKIHGVNARKDILLTELRDVLNGYAGMKMPAYRNAILDYVVRESRQVCGVEISVIELEK